MELLQLRYFMTVAHCQSTTKAAEQLHVAQPSVSQAISRLEKELDVKLFDRKNKRIQLNSFGVVFLCTVENIFESLDKSLEELRLLKSTQAHPLVISIWDSSAICSKILLAFSVRYPYMDLKIVRENAENYELALFTSASQHMPSSSTEALLREEVFLAVHKNHPLAQYDSISLKDAKDENFIMLTKGNPFRQMSEFFCKLAGFTPKVVFESDYSDTLHRMLCLGAGIALLPEKTWSSRKFSHFKMLKIEFPVCMRVIYLRWKQDCKISPGAQLFRYFVKQYFKREYP